ncbi:hypothetical protein E2C01_024572 [Portunus trituberculatus]|uniref:Uncharacterized protein n=1 Tax=Portunus trituberculatus TaxID=210409 RepID=A0A5B7EDI5_PORTR|nr:hypothetical protein [Portunus trituberculatus]
MIDTSGPKCQYTGVVALKEFCGAVISEDSHFDICWHQSFYFTQRHHISASTSQIAKQLTEKSQQQQEWSLMPTT